MDETFRPYAEGWIELLLLSIGDTLRYSRREDPEIARGIALEMLEILENLAGNKLAEKYDTHIMHLKDRAKKISLRCC